MKYPVFYLLALVLLVATSCASTRMDRADCLKADWYELGRQDAILGHGKANFAKYAGDCGAEGAPVDMAALEKGHGVGLPLFCSEAGGLKFGRAGGKYAGLCSAEQEKEFLPAYEIGRNEFELKERERKVAEKEAALALRERVLNFRGIAQSFECRTNEDCRLRGRGRICVAEQLCDGRCRTVGVCK